MAHEITRTDTVGIVNSKGWHGLGKVIGDNMSALEALGVLGLDWIVIESEAMMASFDGESVEVDSHKALRRSDNGEVLGVVSSGYCPLQNKTLAALADSLGSGEAAPRVDTAGSLQGGRKVFIGLRGEDTVMGGDDVCTYLLLANSHDGSGALRIHPTAIRVVCANTYAGSERDAHKGYSWRHSSGLMLRQDEIITALKQWRERIQTMKDDADRMAAVEVTHDRVREVFLAVYERQVGHTVPLLPKTHTEERRKDRAMAALSHMELVFDAERSHGCKPSMWLAANAATNWIQHCSGRLEAEDRAASSLVGLKADQTASAMALVAAMA